MVGFLKTIFAAAVLATLLVVGNARAQTYPDYSEVYVNDFANLFITEQAQEIRNKLEDLRTQHDIEFTVVTIHSMTDYGHAGAIEPFATGLFNTWGVGHAERNDGVMMLVAVNDRYMRIEVGSGYGTTKNDAMKDIIDHTILPKFRSDGYFEGINRGVDQVIRDLTGAYPGESKMSGSEKALAGAKRVLENLGAWIWLILAPFGAIPVKLFRSWQRNHTRKCPYDKTDMVRLDEHWDDNHLQPGQITEEQLDSIDYDVWQCQICQHVTIEAYKSWFSRFGACRSCGYRTLEGDETILESATTSSTGRKRIDYTCHHCHDNYSVTRTIPKKTSSSSSSSSFGGGSSSGGGASGSW
ncbi:TPM domain-containing protein [Shimia thalassica]|uniref:TPM domain-containing protein n=1 Tax=Shimia thalassica TaxID=1715693 RepID=UPI002737130A|nr:TPM domain-containing protein [Shimia thalassica]MDP2520459.1 TPM domain-containing protein [Shimia thalassica]